MGGWVGGSVGWWDGGSVGELRTSYGYTEIGSLKVFAWRS